MSGIMPASPSSEYIERLAHRRVARKLGWYAHACVYIVVNAFLFFGSYFGWRDQPFNVYLALGWGLALLLHFLSVFALGKGSPAREQMVRRERERLQRHQNRP